MPRTVGQANTTNGFSTVLRGRPDYARYLTALETPCKERGHVNEHGVVGQACSTKYIQMLCLEFFHARTASLITLSQSPSEPQADQPRRLAFLVHEIKRLLDHQALFPSAATKARFTALLAIDGSSWFDAACTNLLVEDEWRQFDTVWREDASRKSYLKGSHGWENFLLDEAPGLEMKTVQRINPKSSYQVLPIIALRIIVDHRKEEEEVLRYIHQTTTPVDIAPAETTMLVDFDNPHPLEEKYPEIDLIRATFPAIYGQNPFYDNSRIHHEQYRPGPEHLEQYSSLIHRLENRRPNHLLAPLVVNRPNIFPIIGMRSSQPLKSGIKIEDKDEIL